MHPLWQHRPHGTLVHYTLENRHGEEEDEGEEEVEEEQEEEKRSSSYPQKRRGMEEESDLSIFPGQLSGVSPALRQCTGLRRRRKRRFRFRGSESGSLSHRVETSGRQLGNDTR